MKQLLMFAGIAITGLMLACGAGEDKTASTAPAGTANPSTAAAPSNTDTPDVAAAPAAAANTPDVAAPPPAGDAVTRCLALAAQQKWTEALDPCTQASTERPTDLRIKHAVQQAQAAAGS